MMNFKPIVLTIAGFDPSGCAGVFADIKTFEACNVYGIAVCTANTCQNDVEFTSPNWIPEEQILEQYYILKKRFNFQYIKIGIVENLQVLNTIIDTIKEENESVNIIWDPVLKASAGFQFHSDIDTKKIENICRKLYLITPNLEEIAAIYPGQQPEEDAKRLSGFCNVLLKGGHGIGLESTDVLITTKETEHLTGERFNNSKRGTGCVLSAAITANLALGQTLHQACISAKNYVTTYINSNNTLIGYHNYQS